MRRQFIRRLGFMDTKEREHRDRHGVRLGVVTLTKLHCVAPIDVTFYDPLYHGVSRVVREYVGSLLWNPRQRVTSILTA
jgi:hypothetical protein